MSVGESWAEDILDNMSGILRVFEEQVTVRILQYYTVFRYIQVLGVRMFVWVALGCPRLQIASGETPEAMQMLWLAPKTEEVQMGNLGPCLRVSGTGHTDQTSLQMWNFQMHGQLFR